MESARTEMTNKSENHSLAVKLNIRKKTSERKRREEKAGEGCRIRKEGRKEELQTQKLKRLWSQAFH